jgi:hypothetical protein
MLLCFFAFCFSSFPFFFASLLFLALLLLKSNKPQDVNYKYALN